MPGIGVVKKSGVKRAGNVHRKYYPTNGYLRELRGGPPPDKG